MYNSVNESVSGNYKCMCFRVRLHVTVPATTKLMLLEFFSLLDVIIVSVRRNFNNTQRSSCSFENYFGFVLKQLMLESKQSKEFLINERESNTTFVRGGGGVINNFRL